jgi:catecholate siderophore receptor
MKSNMKSNLPHPFVACSAISAALVSGALGQSADIASASVAREKKLSSLSDSTVVADSIKQQIMAFKTGTPLVDTPSSLSVITRQEIEQQGITTIGQIVDYTPGVSNSQGEGHRDAVVFRGVLSTADFFLDGVRDDVEYYRSLYNIDQVEILRGPNALFFGRGGTGGVINRVSKKPDLSGNDHGYSTSVDSFGGFKGSFDYNQMLNQDTALRLNTMVESLENHRDFFGGDQLGINPVVKHQLSDRSSITFSFEHINHERFLDRGIPTGANGEPVGRLKDVVFADSELNTSSLIANIGKVSFDYSISDAWKVTTTASYASYDKLYQNFFPSAYDETTDIVTIGGYVDTNQRDRFQWSGDLVGEFNTGNIEHKFVVGAELSYTSNDNDRLNAVFSPDENQDPRTENFIASTFRLRNGVGVNANGTTVVANLNTLLNDDTQATIKTYSVFLQDEIALTNWLDFIAGGRFDKFDIDVNGTSSGSKSDNFVSPRVGLVVKPMEKVSLYTSFSETYLPSAGAQYADAGDKFDPDTFQNLEVGVKWNVNENLLMSLAGFKSDQSFTTDLNSDGLQDKQDSEVNGFEAEIRGKISEIWTLAAGYTYLDAVTTSGVTPRDTPEHAFSIWNNYQATEKLSFGLGATYRDETLTGNGSSTKLPSYVRVDAAAAYRFSSDLSIQLNIENLLDTEYYPTSHTSHNATVGAPINASFTLRKSF